MLCALGLCLGLASEKTAHAADVAVDINRFRPAFGTGRLVTLDLAEVSNTLEIAPQLFVHYARNPLYFYLGPDPQFPLVQDRVTGDLGVSVGIPINGKGRLQFGLSLPVTLFQNGDSAKLDQLYNSNPMFRDQLPSNNPAVAGQEDLRFQIKGVLVNGRIGGLGLAGDLKMPTGDKKSFLGSTLPTFDLRLLAHLNLGRLTVALNAGWLFAQDQKVVFTDTGMSLSYGLGMGVKLAKWDTGSLDLMAEVYGLANKNFKSLGETPMEATGAFRLNVKDFHLYLGAGPGIPPNYAKGIGSPDYRVYLGLQYAWHKPKYTPPPPPPPPPPAPDCRCKGPNCACTPGVNCPCTPGVDCPCTPGVDCACTAGVNCACEEGKTCACTPGVNCPCTEGVDCLCKPGVNCARKNIKIKGSVFEFDSPELKPEGLADVSQHLKTLAEHLNGGGRVRIEGHTDNVGGFVYNIRLSRDRAQSVGAFIRKELVAREGLSQAMVDDNIQVGWYSQSCAQALASKLQGKTKLDRDARDKQNEPNRRVEINLWPDTTIKCFVPLPPQQ